jgi:hypothetical protein
MPAIDEHMRLAVAQRSRIAIGIANAYYRNAHIPVCTVVVAIAYAITGWYVAYLCYAGA